MWPPTIFLHCHFYVTIKIFRFWRTQFILFFIVFLNAFYHSYFYLARFDTLVCQFDRYVASVRALFNSNTDIVAKYCLGEEKKHVKRKRIRKWNEKVRDIIYILLKTDWVTVMALFKTSSCTKTIAVYST